MRGSKVTGGGAPAQRPHVGVEALRLERSEAEVWPRLDPVAMGILRDATERGESAVLTVWDLARPISGVKVA